MSASIAAAAAASSEDRGVAMVKDVCLEWIDIDISDMVVPE